MVVGAIIIHTCATCFNSLQLHRLYFLDSYISIADFFTLWLAIQCYNIGL